MTQNLPDLPPGDTTRDGDLGVIPQILGDNPTLEHRMVELGYETARPERPGIWSPIAQRDRDIHDRDSVDLIAPMSLSRDGLNSPSRLIRGARVGAHGKHSVSATEGTELSVLDRSLMNLRSFDGGPSVEAYGAGPAALLCAKAYKLHDRMDPVALNRNRERLRAKDFADLYRLILAMPAPVAASIFKDAQSNARLGPAVQLGEQYLLEITEDAPNVASTVAEAWGDIGREREFRATIRRWRQGYVRSLS